MTNMELCIRVNCNNEISVDDTYITNNGHICRPCENEFIKNYKGDLTEKAIQEGLLKFINKSK